MKWQNAFSMNRFAKSFGHSVDGLRSIYSTEPNFLIHLTAACLVFVMGMFFQIEKWEWCTITFCIGVVWFAEALNTSIEHLTDLASKEQHPLAKKTKDTAAAAVLITCCMSLIIGSIIFIPRFISLIL